MLIFPRIPKYDNNGTHKMLCNDCDAYKEQNKSQEVTRIFFSRFDHTLR